MGHGCCPALTDRRKPRSWRQPVYGCVQVRTVVYSRGRRASHNTQDTMTGKDRMDHQLRWGSGQAHATKDNSVIGFCPAGDSGVKGVCPLGILQVSAGTALDLQYYSLRHEQGGPTCTLHMCLPVLHPLSSPALLPKLALLPPKCGENRHEPPRFVLTF